MRAPATIGMRLDEVDTPALVLELDAFERNLRRMTDAVAGRKIRVRAHSKTHKSPEIARQQVAAGAVGVCCQKVSEAEALVEGGIADVLISNEIVGASKLERLAALSRRARIGICVDDIANLRAIAATGATLDIYVEIDVGARRCGVTPGAAALALAREATRLPNLRFAGLQAYHGAAQHVRAMVDRRAQIKRAAEAAQSTRKMIEAAGVACPIVTGGGSGTFMFEIESGAYDEIQPGSYIFMDADYARNEWAAPLPRFEHALFVLATVMSRPAPVRAVVDAGLKASSVDSGLPQVWQRPGLTFVRASDEHGVIEVAADRAAPALGEKLLLVPGHCDPTVNLHEWYVCVRGGRVEALWPIAGRGAMY
ncbi:MAG TPA: DSD1 family PLP-dependent enzyme [Burkholderiales bacterium]|jgi:D-serine deaminase-like pyridoxal phosphate-dependent protein|nr:DSD1 family PLP-dependent enzyme [Burkholderiales bacterium]